jgi:hypothetical protein
MFSTIETRADKTQVVWESMMNHFVGSVDLTGAELEYAGCCLSVINGKLGNFDLKTRQVSGNLSVLSLVRPSVLSSLVRIRWRNHEFEVMMLSIQGMGLAGELKLKFVARWIPSDMTLFK